MPSVRPPLVILLTLAAVLFILFIRKTDAVLNPQFYAEDAYIFFYQARYMGLRAILEPYSGYYHLVPRLIAAACSGAPALYAPALYMLATAGFTVGVIATVFSPRIDLPCRPLLALALVLVPHSGEVFLNITNIQWMFAPVFLLLLLSRDPSTKGEWAFDLITLALFAFTGPFVMLWLPLFWRRAWSRRSRASAVLASLACVAAAAQIHAYFQGKSPVQQGVFLIDHCLRVPGARVWGTLFLPRTWVQAAGIRGDVMLAVIGVGVTFLLLSGSRHRATRLVLFFAAALVLASTLYKFHGQLRELDGVTNGDRYFYIPQVIVIWLLVFQLWEKGWRPWISGGFLALCALASASAFKSPPFIHYDWSAYADHIDADEDITVPINPPGWQIHFPARQRP